MIDGCRLLILYFGDCLCFGKVGKSGSIYWVN